MLRRPWNVRCSRRLSRPTLQVKQWRPGRVRAVLDLGFRGTAHSAVSLVTGFTSGPRPLGGSRCPRIQAQLRRPAASRISQT